jgi:hypothetical protein
MSKDEKFTFEQMSNCLENFRKYGSIIEDSIVYTPDGEKHIFKKGKLINPHQKIKRGENNG